MNEWRLIVRHSIGHGLFDDRRSGNALHNPHNQGVVGPVPQQCSLGRFTDLKGAEVNVVEELPIQLHEATDTKQSGRIESVIGAALDHEEPFYVTGSVSRSGVEERARYNQLRMRGIGVRRTA